MHAQSDNIRKSFRVCGISNNMDGSENHLIRCAKELPVFQIPYGSHTDSDTEDIFNSSSSDSVDTDSEL